MSSTAPDTPPRRGRRASLRHEQIVESALQMAGDDGLEAVSMRRLAAALGVSTMTLYGYFTSKAVLLRAMLDRVSDEFEPAVIDEVSWDDRLRLIAHRVRASIREYPGLAPLFIQRPHPRGRALEVVEDAVGALRAAGVPGDVAVRGVYAVMGYAIGFVAQEVRRADDDSHLDYAELSPERFPNLTELSERAAGFASEAQFDFGLEALIDRVGRHAAAT